MNRPPSALEHILVRVITLNNPANTSILSLNVGSTCHYNEQEALQLINRI